MRAKSFLRDTSGASALEFALLLPLFAFLLLGTMQIGHVFWTQTALQHAVERAARCASINTAVCGNVSQIQAYAATQTYGMTLPDSTFAVSVPPCGNQVEATHDFTFETALFPVPTVTLSARSCYPR